MNDDFVGYCFGVLLATASVCMLAITIKFLVGGCV
jgi:hypothetical protein